MSAFAIKDSGARQEFASGMQRDTTEGKINYLSVRFGPMFRRWADHLTKGRVKYPDVTPGTPNWTLANGVEEYLRAKESADRHFTAWVAGERDEDHAAGVFFNINLAEYVLEQDPTIDPALGAKVVKPSGAQIVDDFFPDLEKLSEQDAGLQVPRFEHDAPPKAACFIPICPIPYPHSHPDYCGV